MRILKSASNGSLNGVKESNKRPLDNLDRAILEGVIQFEAIPNGDMARTATGIVLRTSEMAIGGDHKEVANDQIYERILLLEAEGRLVKGEGGTGNSIHSFKVTRKGRDDLDPFYRISRR